jgi:hypothetical protein
MTFLPCAAPLILPDFSGLGAWRLPSVLSTLPAGFCSSSGFQLLEQPTGDKVAVPKEELRGGAGWRKFFLANKESGVWQRASQAGKGRARNTRRRRKSGLSGLGEAASLFLYFGLNT